MSTRSYIGIDNGDNTATFIYCNYDGYPQGVGATLYKYYKDAATVKKLISLGYISILGNKPDDKKSAEYWRLESSGAFNDLDKYITDDDTISYNSRGEDPELNKAFTVDIDNIPTHVAYVYLFRGNRYPQWYVYDFYEWRRLDRVLGIKSKKGQKAEKTLKDIQNEIANMKVSRSSDANHARLTRHGYEDGKKIYFRGSNGRKYWVAPYAARNRIGLNYSNKQSTVEKWCA